ncbi:uncharacterized protein LOC108839283 [Raphanus sativus]|uniref:Uncharacterized protein LOC108839283 n=1 Tax=Raphanus sativus TaxID=3726 RepID=A0A9W3DDZ8_RAPSA|nr:uncharacterized protein LOC108839283 [Raphanus sativus]
MGPCFRNYLNALEKKSIRGPAIPLNSTRRTRDPQVEEMIRQIKNFKVVLQNNVEDKALWRQGDGIFGAHFSTFSTWDMIRERRQSVPWQKLVWFKQGVPRFAFITWLAVKDRLSTGVKMRTWGQNQGCLFCGDPEETRDHLFFAYPYTYTLWLQVLGTLIQPAPSPDWEENVQVLLAGSHGLLVSILVRLSFQVTVYYLWRERKERRHSQRTRTVDQLARIIDKTIRQRILSTRYAEKPKLRDLLQCWFGAHMRHS